MDVFPDNKITRFKTQLSKRVTLIGEWECSVCEIHFPYVFNTISAKDFWVAFEVPPTENSGSQSGNSSSTGQGSSPGGAVLTFAAQGGHIWTVSTFPEGMYSTIDNLLSVMRSDPAFKSAVDIFVHSGKIQIRLKQGTHAVNMSPALQRILNLPSKDFQSYTEAVNPFQLDALIPTQMYIYSDIAEPQHVGDICAPLLRIVNIEKHKYPLGATITKTFTQPHYVPVSKREFNQIEIDIRDDLGNPLPFLSGQLNVKLHFRKVK
ncbi:unnamed protein product [Bemisia tabaci]|uniref:Uncharacterized protein n=1 Tax=Bemisia tabaci TaxID=7038 RepID=A0A9P0F330_BEMTA|nr:unnamed protein product [Bemisia tabaci]